MKSLRDRARAQACGVALERAIEQEKGRRGGEGSDESGIEQTVIRGHSDEQVMMPEPENLPTETRIIMTNHP